MEIFGNQSGTRGRQERELEDQSTLRDALTGELMIYVVPYDAERRGGSVRRLIGGDEDLCITK